MHKRKTRLNVAPARVDAQAASDAQVLEVMKHQEAAFAHGKPMPTHADLTV